MKLTPTEAWSTYRPSREIPWTKQLAAHLFRRSGFGGTIREIESSVEAGVDKTLDQLFESTSDASIEMEMKAAGRLLTSGSDSNALSAWWLLRMTKTNSPFLEQMAFFWHGHFATGAEKVMDSRAMLRQNELLRKHAFGNYGPLVKDISSDTAMLVYLDSEENRKTRPNENYARELMELFCLGTGNYTENDIKEIARCFTGWEIRKGKFRFNQHQHDKKSKSFLGASGEYDGNDAIRVVLQQSAAPQFIARKLIRFFVFDDQPISNEFLQPVADHLRKTDFDIRSTVRMILSSNVFYSEKAVGKKIKSPVELAIGFLRFFEASTNMNQMATRLRTLGQAPFFPPNVKGWPGGRTWINASSILGRANLIADILQSDKTKFKAGSLDDWAKKNSSIGVGESLQWAEDYLLAVPLNAESRKRFKEMASNESFGPLKQLAWLAALPEFQLG